MEKTTRLSITVLLVLLTLAVCIQGSSAQADKPHPKGYVACKTTSPIQMDGKLTEAAWKSAPWTDDFQDIEGAIRPTPRFRTRAKMLWDDNYLYIGAELQEPHVWATLQQRDTVIFIDNDFEVFIDPNGDNHEYYEFEMNARNTVWDLFLPKPYKDSGGAVDVWNIDGLKTAVSVQGTLNNPNDTDTSWTVEIAFPWKGLAWYAHKLSPPADGDQWRIDFSRVEWLNNVINGWYQKIQGKPEDNWVWSPQGVVNMHRPETWGFVQFSTRKPGTKVPFRPDAAWEVKCILHDVYYAQHAYRERTKSWAENLDQLGLPASVLPAMQKGLSMKTFGNNFVVRMPLKLKGGKAEHWFIRQDALLWKD
jgi:hypothetical protein